MSDFYNTYWPKIRDYVFIVIGTLIQAIGLRVFLVPANLASGGVSGIAQLIHHFTAWPLGVMIFFGNFPLFILGWRFLGGRQFALRTAVAIITYAFFTDALTWIPHSPIHGLTDDILLNSLYGAVASGIGYGLVYRGQGTSGGSDILARILNHWRGISMTQSYLMTDALVILGAGLVFGWKEALYALITLYVSGLVVDTALEGGGTVRSAVIVTAQGEEVGRKITAQMERGATLLGATGAFTGAEKTMLYCVVTRSEIPQLKRIVSEADPLAFMVVGAVHEALGEGFQPFKKD